jgi:MFS family permease
MQMLVRGVIVFNLTGSYAALGLISLANAIPGLFLSLPGGLLADRAPKKLVVQVGQASNMIVCGAIATLLLTDMLVFWHLVACAVLQGGINALIMPARQSMIPEIVDGERMMNAVALNSAGMNVMRLAAPALGGVLLAALGAGWVYMTMGLLYGVGAIFLMPVRNRDLTDDEVKALSAQNQQNNNGSLRDIIEGCKYITRDGIVAMILIANFLIVLVSMPYQMMLPGFAKDVLDASDSQIGLLMSVTGIGSLAGSLVIASMPERNRGRVLLVSSLFLGFTMLAFAASSWYWLTAAIVVGIGIGQAGRMSLSNVLIQSYTAKEYRGRVMSVYMLEFSLVSFGTFLVGILANVVGAQVALGGTAIGLIVLTLAYLLFVPRMRRLN